MFLSMLASAALENRSYLLFFQFSYVAPIIYGTLTNASHEDVPSSEDGIFVAIWENRVILAM